MVDENQTLCPPMPEEQPPAYPEVSQPLMGFAPSPGPASPSEAAPSKEHPHPAGTGYGIPSVGHTQPGMPSMSPGVFVAGKPVDVQPVIGGTPVVIINQDYMFRQSPVDCVCPHCGQHIITGITAEAGGLTWLICAVICVVGCWLGCCLIPFCIDECQDVRHNCPNCKKTIHVYRRL